MITIAPRHGTAVGWALRSASARSRRPRLPDRVLVFVGTLKKILYWGVVLAISLALVVGLILFFESRDDSSLEDSGSLHGRPAVALL
jgi:hypothetical protein